MAQVHLGMHARDVGIRGLYLYFPKMMVLQADLEAADGCAGKYTAGLGQQALAFCGDREDAVSLAATAMLRLLEGAGVALTDIGRLEVGTESGVDRSKSIMSYLVHYFSQAGNHSLQGSDRTHGCYGATAALLSVADWVSGPSWDGRLGLVVATDVAVYPPGSPARPTGGAGAAAMLVGPDAPLVLEPWPWRSSFAAHTFDFFKPHGVPLYPVVDGPASLAWFTRAADACGAALHAQLAQAGLLPAHQGGSGGNEQESEQQQQESKQQDEQHEQQQQQQQQPEPGLLGCVDYFLSHAPYNKLVRKVFGRLALADGLRSLQLQQEQQQLAHKQQQQQQQAGKQEQQQLPSQPEQQQERCQQQETQAPQAVPEQQAPDGQPPPMQPVQQQLAGQAGTHVAAAGTSSGGSSSSRGRPPLPPLPPEALSLDPCRPLPDSSIGDKALERALLAASSELYAAMAAPPASLQTQLGNLYTASLYAGLASLLDQQRSGLEGKRLLCFSFGSGVVASMFVLRGRATGGGSSGSGGSGGSGGGLQGGACGSGGGTGCGCQQQQQQQQQPSPREQAARHWGQAECSLQCMAEQLCLPQRLAGRQRCSVAQFDAAMASLAAAYGAAPHTPSYGTLDDLEPGTVYLQHVDEASRRTYGRTPSGSPAAAAESEAAAAPP